MLQFTAHLYTKTAFQSCRRIREREWLSDGLDRFHSTTHVHLRAQYGKRYTL
jgi:hypothetical protein